MNKRQLAKVEQDFFSVILHTQLTGDPIDDSIASLTSVSKPTWYRRKAQMPALYQKAAIRAAQDALEMRQQMQAQLLQQRLTAELQVQNHIVTEVVGVVKAVVAGTKLEGTSLRDVVAAGNALSRWAREGMVVTQTPEDTAKQADALPYDPNLGVTASQLSLPPGTRLVVTTPEVVDVVPFETIEDEPLEPS